MKRLLLRFENNNKTIFSIAVIAMMIGLATGIAFFNRIIAAGCLLAILCTGLIATLLYYAIRKEVIIDFKHNLIKMKTGTIKEQCELDKVKNLNIVFHWVSKMNCYSAQISAYLKDGKTISIKIHPENYRYKLAYYFTGRVTDKLKIRIERQVNGYDFITCFTKK